MEVERRDGYWGGSVTVSSLGRNSDLLGGTSVNLSCFQTGTRLKRIVHESRGAYSLKDWFITNTDTLRIVSLTLLYALQKFMMSQLTAKQSKVRVGTSTVFKIVQWTCVIVYKFHTINLYNIIFMNYDVRNSWIERYFMVSEYPQEKKYMCNICFQTTLQKCAGSTCQTEIAKLT